MHKATVPHYRDWLWLRVAVFTEGSMPGTHFRFVLTAMVGATTLSCVAGDNTEIPQTYPDVRASNAPTEAWAPNPNPPTSAPVLARTLDATVVNTLPGYNVSVYCGGDRRLGFNAARLPRTQSCQLRGTAVAEIRIAIWRREVLIAERKQRINLITGQVLSGDIDTLAAMRSRTLEKTVAFSVGFYQPPNSMHVPAGNQLSLYVYATPLRTGWMGAASSLMADAPLQSWILPGAHDAGAYTVDDSMAPLAQTLAAAGFAQPHEGLANLLLRQKDSIYGQLQQGIRYLDFHPGYAVDYQDPATTAVVSHAIQDAVLRGRPMASPDVAVSKTIVNQRGVLSGARLADSLDEILKFLQQYPQEVVVLNFNRNGTLASAAAPPADALAREVNDALQRAKWATPTERPITAGDAGELTKSHSFLVQANRRLIVTSFDGRNAQEHATMWTATHSRLQELQRSIAPSAIAAPRQNPVHAANLVRIDANLPETRDVLYAAFSGDALSSQAHGIKPAMDRVMYAWLDAARPLHDLTGLRVVMNDFADAALTEHVMRANFAEHGK